MHLQQAEERAVEIGRHSIAGKLLPERLLDDFHLAREPGAGFFVGRVLAVHFVNFGAEIKGALKRIHVEEGGGNDGMWAAEGWRLNAYARQIGMLGGSPCPPPLRSDG